MDLVTTTHRKTLRVAGLCWCACHFCAQLEYLGQEPGRRVHPRPPAVTHWVRALQVAALQSWTLCPGWQETVLMRGCFPDCLSLQMHAASVHMPSL